MRWSSIKHAHAFASRFTRQTFVKRAHRGFRCAIRHHAGQILEYLQTVPVPGLRCQLSYEPDILGTGGALPKAHWFLDRDPFWMVNADVLADVSCKPLLESHHRNDSIATLWLHPERGPRTVEHRNGLVTVFKSPVAGTEGTATFCGLQLLSPRILDYLPSAGFSSIIDAYENALISGEKIGGVIVPGSYWADIGKPETYLATHQDMMTHPRWKKLIPRGKNPVACGRNTTVAADAVVVRSVLWDNVTLSPGARVENAIISDGVTVYGRASHMAMRADHFQDPVLARILKTLQWPPAATTVMPLPPRGSARTFTRLVTPKKSAILVQYTLERPENGLYTRHARFLTRCGVRVPEVLLDWQKEKVCVLEDAGEDSLEHLIPNLSRSDCLALYRKTLDSVARLHSHATRAWRRHPIELSMPFTRHLYEWEQNLFCEQFLGRHRTVSETTLKKIRQELARLIPAQLRAPRVIIHRDLQSSNVLVKEGGIFLIDFQGMRLGTAAYDLASLLCDPYINLSDDLRDELLNYYLGLVPDPGPVRDLFWVAAVERLAQALGAFGRLGAVSTTSYFLKHIPSGVRQLQYALSHLPGLPLLKKCLEG